MEGPKHPLHLKYPDLQRSLEVRDAVEKKERLEDTKLANDPRERIDAYMDRLENIFLNKKGHIRERNIEMLQEKIYDAFIIKREHVPESYFQLQQRIARERGQEVESISPEIREQMIDTVIEDQKESLDRWVHYLTSNDAMYPTWFKYLVFRNVTQLSQFDKKLGKFKERTESTVATFPDIYYEPLAQIADLYQSVDKERGALQEPATRDFFNKKFPALYAELAQRSLAARMESGEETRGEWRKYEQGDMDHAEELFDSLQGKGTGWCTAGYSTAEMQIESGDFYAYYTYDKHGEPTQPRIAIRMEEDKIAEVRGILEHQQLEPQMQEVLDEKFKEFGPEADTYRKKSADMKLLTVIETKIRAAEELTSQELRFLYEIDSSIEGFGYEKDPRVEELQAMRNQEADLPLIFECDPADIAHSEQEITDTTKVYIGKLFPDFFNKVPSSVTHMYEYFPDIQIWMRKMEIGGLSRAELKLRLRDMWRYHDSDEQRLLDILPISREKQEISIVILSLGAMGFTRGATKKDVYKRAYELGLDLLPAEVGPHLRLQYIDQPTDDDVNIGMESLQITPGIRGLSLDSNERVIFNISGDSMFDMGKRISATYGYQDSNYLEHQNFAFRLPGDRNR